jgi:hypothetical protein
MHLFSGAEELAGQKGLAWHKNNVPINMGCFLSKPLGIIEYDHV